MSSLGEWHMFILPYAGGPGRVSFTVMLPTSVSVLGPNVSKDHPDQVHKLKVLCARCRLMFLEGSDLHRMSKKRLPKHRVRAQRSETSRTTVFDADLLGRKTAHL
jgi:hypothetical protein